MGKQLIVLFAGVLAAALVATGCGGGGDSSSASITKAEFIEQADAACKEGAEGIQEDFAAYIQEHELENSSSKATKAQFVDVVNAVLVPNVEAELEELRALGAPSGEEEQVKAILEAREEGLEKAEAQPKVAIQNTTNFFAKSAKLAQEYGLESCGSA